jgi:regulation of enolase protein 1 (concanavalin A-like superfamily)
MRKYVSAAALRLPLLALLVCAPGLARAQSIPSPWTARDIGAPALAGSASYSGEGFQIDAAGADIWGVSDQFHFVYRQIAGDVDVRARVDSISAADPWSKAGLMIRGALTAGSAHGFVLVSAGKGTAFQRRAQTGGTSASSAGPTGTAPRWVRLVRKGSSLTAYVSSTGTTWTTVGSASIALGSSAYVGIAVTSHDTTTRTTAQVSNVTFAGAGLPAGQQAADIGSPGLRGATAFDAGIYTIKAAGTDIWDSADQFHFVYQQASGDLDVVARIASLANVHRWSKAGVMIRESLEAGSRHALALTSSGAGYAFQRRPAPDTWSLSTSGGSGAPPGWVRLVRKGDTIEAFRSANGTTWTSMGSDTIQMGQAVYVGIAVTSHNAGTATTVRADSFRITESAPVANKPPTVALSSPLGNAAFIEPATINFAATAGDPEGRLSRVEFLANGALVGSDTSAPYTLSWGVVPAGAYSLTAVARDADGGSATSAAVAVTVSAATPAPAPRMIAFIPPADHATNVTSYLLEIFAASANPATATPRASSDLGKPAPSGGEIVVDRAAVFSALAPGSYIATVTAIGPGGRTRSASVAFTR